MIWLRLRRAVFFCGYSVSCSSLCGLASLREIFGFWLSVGGEASHEANQALDLFLVKIGVRRHGAGFADGDAATLDHGPDPVVQGSSLPSRVGQILWFLS